MKRNLKHLASKEYDILIIGGGIYGVSTAREAALRGLSVALVEKGDFGSATSANSLKIIHGGLRYLQQLDVPRIRESIVERRNMMRIAPHLVHPLPCIMPTYGHTMKGKEAMALGLLAYGILSLDRNSLTDPEKYIPSGRILSKEELNKLVPGLEKRNFTGGITWHDAYAHNTERLASCLVRSAVDAGAEVANHAEVTGFIQEGPKVCGATIKDNLSDGEYNVRAKVVVTNTGPWTNEIIKLLDRPATLPIKGLALGVNFVLNRQLIPKHALGISSPATSTRDGRLLFFMPWKERTIVGTYYRTHEGHPSALKVTPEDIDTFLGDVNRAYPDGNLTTDDISLIHAGLIPTKTETHDMIDPPLLMHPQMIDHEKEDGIQGLFSVVGVKYTTARDIAERTIKQLAPRFEQKLGPSRSAELTIPGGDTDDFNGLLAEAELQDASPFLVMNYGTEYSSILETAEKEQSLLKAQIRHAVETEMAMTLSDVVFRRTDMGTGGAPDSSTLHECATIMADMLAWDADRVEKEIAQVKAVTFPGSEMM